MIMCRQIGVSYRKNFYRCSAYRSGAIEGD
nr:MAG TPA: hypothetical protein [Caudoviricetes sp.]